VDEGDSDSGEDGPQGHHQPGGPHRNGVGNAAGGLTLDEEREAKRMRRLMRNRLSAHQARERKKLHQAEVNTISQQLHQRHAVLQDAVTVLTKENATLKALLRTVLPIQAGM
jgi:transcription factor HY5